MCNSTAALIGVQIASAGLQYKMQKQQAQHEWWRQKKQNELAKQNAIQRYAAEQLKIRQVAKKFADKEYAAARKSRKKRHEFIALSGDAGLALSGSTNRLLGDYFRIEGNYKASLEKNMNINISQYERNLEAIQFGQEAQSTYLTPPNSNLLFASAALGLANNYYNLQARKEAEGIK